MAYNEGLQAKQKELKDATVESVNWAVNTIRDLEGETVKIKAKKISQLTGLSRTVLYKKHVRGIWDPNWSDKLTKHQENLNHLLKEKEIKGLVTRITELTTQLQKSQLKVDALTVKLEYAVSRSSVFKKEYEDLKGENENLLHQYLELLRHLHARDIDITKFQKS